MVRDDVSKLIVKFAHVFKTENEEIPAITFYEQDIQLTPRVPVYVRQYRLPHAHKEEIDRQVKRLAEQGVLRLSNSDYNNPNLLVPKKNGKWRMVTDFRQLNKVLVKDRYPLPRFEDIFDGMRCGESKSEPKFFSVFDLVKGFYQIPLTERARKFTAFSRDSEQWDYARLPQGLAISPNSLGRMMVMAFKQLIGNGVYIFIDDLVVKSHTITEHVNLIQKVLEICNEKNLSLNPEKVQFFQNRVTYLG